MLTILVDDLRNFKKAPDGVVKVFRNSRPAIEWFKSQDPQSLSIDALWLDHDLGLVDDEVDTVWPLIEFLEYQHHIEGVHYPIKKINVQSMNSVEVPKMLKALEHLGYPSYRASASTYFTSNPWD